MDEEKPDIIAQAEAETPAETAPAFGAPQEEQPAKKPKKSLYALAVILCLAVIGTATWFLFKNKDANAPIQNQISNNQQETLALEPVEVSKLALKGNDLSDFDLAFLHLENNQDNVIYSPLSIKYALAMLQEGTNGNSKAQIEALIGDYKPKAYLNSANRSLANAFFIKDDFRDNVLDSYIQALDTKYNASVILDPLNSADNVNSWVSDKTLGIIKNLLQDNQLIGSRFVLVNALAIDMTWQNRIQCVLANTDIPCITYGVHYPNTNYSDSVGNYEASDGYEHDFGNKTVKYETVRIGATSNHYDLLKEIGEDQIRQTVQAAYDEWLAKAETSEWDYDPTFNLDDYMARLGNAGFGDHKISTDFFFLDSDSEKVFAKDLKEYDGSTLQYISIMPKTQSLSAYINNLTAEKANSLISNLKDISDYNNFKDGVVTRVKGSLPLFKFNYSLGLNNDLNQLGITDIFDSSTADLTNMVEQNEQTEGIYIQDTIHKADIEFTNDGIKAAAATAIVGGMGAAGPMSFNYNWELPVEEIDLTFDKPFLFLIRDKSTGEVWFTGTVYDPSKN